ncbi:M14 family metallopeptidase [Bacillus pinisoli]|uniref:M14 family metallopeptidase n=1 Tax=Bacillus pinisoli TaxID=2901866 RepID=UPI001FF3B706|nr:M14 family metallopeptidase [Bacillus pinisoli]
MEVTVRLGDSLWYYSQLFGLPLDLILDSNTTEYQRSIRVGNRVKIPGFTNEPYRIKAGDTTWKLAQQRNISVDALLLLNAKQPQSHLQVGETIQLPLRLTERAINGKKEYSYQTLVDDLQILQAHYPFIKVKSIGKSVLGREIFELKVGNGPKKVHMNGSFHANEWITTAIIMQYVNDMLSALTHNGSLNGVYMLPFYHEVSLSIVPMVNPDGVDLVLLGPPEEEPYYSKVMEINNGSLDFSNWKANIQGVDLNNQYPAYWEIEKERKEPKKPAPRDYPGGAPLTEPEAMAMAQLTVERDFHRIVAFHTQGKEMYWGYLDLEPQEAGRIAAEFERVSGYKAIQHIDSHAGYRDWFIYKWKRPGYTIELGEGVNPLPLSQFDDIYKDSLGIFLASLYM